MKKPGKYLKFYLKYVECGVLPAAGLCSCFCVKGVSDIKRILLFEPSYHECLISGHDALFWGGERSDIIGFNTFRQNVVLFCAAMNNEL